MSTSAHTPRKLLLGITGGIAAYKAAELVRLLVKQGIDVQVVMTKAACEFITPMTMQALSGNPVYTELWASGSGNGMQHIEQVRDCDAVLIAPASADFIAKLTYGLADDLLSTLCLARQCDLLIAPAMNKQMWANPATQRNIQQLINDGVLLLGPDSGVQACGEVGLGRMVEPAVINEAIIAHFTPKTLANKRILITAGATMEMIDPVRGITNLSSGKMGYALAKIASQMGAEVTLVSGLSHEPVPANVNIVCAKDAKSMHDAVIQHIEGQDVMIGVAAVADYSPDTPSQQKLKKTADTLTITLTQNPDIIATVASLPSAPYCVGFAAETENLIEYASKKRIKKNLPMIVANLVQESMGLNSAQLTVITDKAITPLNNGDKTSLARQLLMMIHTELSNL